MRTPVVFCVFNRPAETARVFSRIEEMRPPRLFLVADGPRPGRPDDVAQCAATRALLERIDWDCEVQRDFSDHNLGCTQRMTTGISWAFSHVDEAIILEDDCLPDPTFFRFCDELLERYRDHARVTQIAGFNVPLDRRTKACSYYFSRFATNWGWATWKRAWQHYDVGVKEWPALKETSWLLDIVKHRNVADSWGRMLDLAHRHGLETHWDYQWVFSCWLRRGLSVQPSVSMITNVGFGPSATHTKSSCHDPRADVKAAHMSFPLRHPAALAESPKADRIYMRQVILPATLNQGILTRLQKKWWDFKGAHPSLRSWQSFSHRVRQKSLSLFGLG